MKATPADSRIVMAPDYMWMGAVDLVDGRRLHLYKNAMTRRYLRLDSHGHAYTHVDGDYRIHRSPADAIDDLCPPGPINDPAFGDLSVTGTFVGGETQSTVLSAGSAPIETRRDQPNLDGGSGQDRRPIRLPPNGTYLKGCLGCPSCSW